MVNKIWSFLIITGILICLITNRIDVVNNQILNSTKVSLEMIMQIFPVMALWLGIMNIASKAGLLEKLSNLVSPILKKIFPDIPKNHESLSFITSNIIASMFGLGNAATPFGLKAMKSLQTLNDKKDTASRSMITFLVLNTSGFTLIPTTVISLRLLHKSVNPTSIILLCFIASLISTIGGLVTDSLLARRYK